MSLGICINCQSPSQYPEWLDANKPSLSSDDYQRYEQQAKIMGEICKHFEKEDEETGDKESTFERIMDLMQQVHLALPLYARKVIQNRSANRFITMFFDWI